MNMSPRTETKLEDLGESGGAGEMEMYYKGTGSYSQVEAESSHILPLTFWLFLYNWKKYMSAKKKKKEKKTTHMQETLNLL